MPAEAVSETLRRVRAILDEQKILYALMGGLSLAAWNRIRATHDIDFLIGVDGVRVQSLLSRFGAAGFRAKGKQAIVRLPDAEFIQLSFEPPETFVDVQVDLLMADNEFQRQALERRVSYAIPGLAGGDLPVLTCEDLIVMKLDAGRIIDLVDAAALLRSNKAKIDMPYLMKWVKGHELERQFVQASEEAARMDAMHE